MKRADLIQQVICIKSADAISMDCVHYCVVTSNSSVPGTILFSRRLESLGFRNDFIVGPLISMPFNLYHKHTAAVRHVESLAPVGKYGAYSHILRGKFNALGSVGATIVELAGP